MKYFDAHCHIQFDAYDTDRGAILASMKEAEIGGLIVGTDRATSRAAAELADGQTLFATIGLHPNDKPAEGYDDAVYRELASMPHVVGIGECGLDYFRPEHPEAEKARQQEAFKAQIRLAAESDKPLMLHIRPSKGTMDAYEDAFSLLEEAKVQYGDRVRGNSHFHTGNVAVTKRLVDLGFTASYTAVLTFARDYDETVRSLPLTHILSETDAPYLAPAPNRGKRNDPGVIPQIVKAIADIRGEEEEVVRAAVLENARRLFRLP